MSDANTAALYLARDAAASPIHAEAIDRALARIAELEGERDEYKALYEAGCNSWRPAYEQVLNERDARQSRLQSAESRLQAAEQELSAVRQRLGEQWQPIETAPKDGRVVLFCDAHGNRWTDAEHGVCASNDCGYPAVYWMELPLPPITPAPQAKEAS